MKTIIVLIAMALVPGVTAAQDAGSMYVAGGLVVPYQDGVTGEAPQTYSAASGGWTAGVFAAAGVFVTGHLAAEAEWARTGVMTSTQPSRYGMTFNDRRRDQFLSLLVRVPLTSGPVRVEPVGGVVFTFPEASTQTDRVSFTGAPVVEHEPTVIHDLDTHLGFTIGCDVRIGSPRVAIVPSFRFSDTGVTNGRYSTLPGAVDTDISSIYPGGYPHWTYRAGVGVRVGF